MPDPTPQASTPRRAPHLQCGRFDLDLSRPLVMAIINATPDSFSGDGIACDVGAALARAEAAVEAGAGLLDIGGESSRPGAAQVSEQEELDRVIPLVERLSEWSVPVSIDTTKPAVMRAGLAAGASMINDINAFRAEGALDAVVDSDAGLCVMHMQGQPRTMQSLPQYADVVAEVGAFLVHRVDALLSAGVAAQRVLLDPGFGFGKTLEHNLALLRDIDRIVSTGFPVLVGLSRKSMLGLLTGRPVDQRGAAGVAAALLAVARGARVIRTHDVAQTRDALKVWEAVRG